MKFLMALLIGTGGLALAQNLEGFQTPSKNIHCMLYENELRCDLLQNTAPIPPRPQNCDLDWGNVFAMTSAGKPIRVCYGDTVMNPNHPVLQYGQVWKKAGFTCTSLTSGLRCVNKNKKGWLLTRGKQSLF